ncbi:Alpha/Beta hydrolase protein [Boeremia exigua]|uniref:Alpha/Beta hydrolase protein n=1 Tax=Boeremia exigua TaxID=749465 RepID=UPI001E8E5DC0|nr:Alpha/Beta hydrolase protein [Boeremia exigua]KAH6615397.1 Alpha/Beta hydrolase protein [Boeremia exigua]
MAGTGVFIGVAGLTYDNGVARSVTSTDSEFRYYEGETVTFSIGSLVLGSCIGRPLVTISDLLPIDTPTFHPRTVNRARLLYSLAPGQGFEKPAVIDQKVEDVVASYVSKNHLDSDDVTILDEPLAKVCSTLHLRPKTVSLTRNHLRREAAGFKVLRDLEIPSPDGGHILADVYLPLKPGKKFPVLVSCTLYGRRVAWGGPDLHNDREIASFEQAEDTWHSTPAGTDLPLPNLGPWSNFYTGQRGFENVGSFNTFSYVPNGYAMVKIDPKGVSQTPGARWIPGQLTRDFHAAVEWSAEQTWSNGSVALVGSSYGANTQWAVAAMKPKGLKCFVPYDTDIDSYREAAYIGGIPATRYLENWFARVRGVSSKWNDQSNIELAMQANPEYNALWKMLEADPKHSIEIPCFLAASQIFMLHGRAAYEAWMVRRPENTHLQLVDSNYFSWPSREVASKILQFLNHYLKGEHILPPERVGIQMRLGNQAWSWRKERNWPVPGTQYTKWHLTESGLSTLPPSAGFAETRFGYQTKATPIRKSGVSFQSPQFMEDVDLAGHFTTVLSVSSTAPDADVVALLWAVDEAGLAVSYGAHSLEPEPIAKGFLRVSHRKLDTEKSTPWRPVHTHTKEDLAHLRGADDVAEIAIEMFPAACRVRKGWALRLDICPSEYQPDIPGYKPAVMRQFYGELFEGDATDGVHVGGDRNNYILCPVVPLSECYPQLCTICTHLDQSTG